MQLLKICCLGFQTERKMNLPSIGDIKLLCRPIESTEMTFKFFYFNENFRQNFDAF